MQKWEYLIGEGRTFPFVQRVSQTFAITLRDKCITKLQRMFIRPLTSLFLLWLITWWLNSNACGQAPRHAYDLRLHKRVTIKYTCTDALSCGIIMNLCVLKHNYSTMNNVRILKACIVTRTTVHDHLYIL